MKVKFQQLKELLGQVEVLRTYYARLTERERVIAILSTTGVAVFLLFSFDC